MRAVSGLGTLGFRVQGFGQVELVIQGRLGLGKPYKGPRTQIMGP